MVLKRVTQLTPPPSRAPPRPSPSRAVRNTLIQLLLAEIAGGDSMIKLYARLLAQEILCHDPELARKYRHQLDAVED